MLTGDRVVLSRYVLAAGGATLAVNFLPQALSLLDPESFRVPRVGWWGPSLLAFCVLAACLVGGSLVYLSERATALLGWLLPVGTALLFLYDRQVTGEYIYLAGIFGFYHWMGAILRRRESEHAQLPYTAARIQITIVFLWTAFAKMTPIFLSGAVLAAVFSSTPLPTPAWLITQRVLMIAAVIVILTELFIGIALWVPRYRSAALLLAAALHVGIVVLFRPTLVFVSFAAVMAVGYALFLEQGDADRA